MMKPEDLVKELGIPIEKANRLLDSVNAQNTQKATVVWDALKDTGLYILWCGEISNGSVRLATSADNQATVEAALRDAGLLYDLKGYFIDRVTEIYTAHWHIKISP